MKSKIYTTYTIYINYVNKKIAFLEKYVRIIMETEKKRGVFVKKDKKILLFSDLEGTILRESDGKYDKEDMYNFLEQIDRLQQLTGTKVNIHLVSPIYKEQMEEIIDMIDRDIVKYNIAHPDHDRIPRIECGTFSPDQRMCEEEYSGDRVMPLKMPIDSRQFDTSIFGKADHVRKWCDMYKEREELLMSIYCGNGRNDLSAMDFIKKNKGFVVCPDNSRKIAKEQADFVSDKTDLSGIAEGIANINKEIDKRVSQQAKEEPEEQEQ